MLILTFFIGLIANFIGYVPPGNINLTLVKVAINRGIRQALQFIIAFSIVEFFVTYIIMHGAKWLSGQVKLDIVIDWVMMVLFTVMGVITWRHRKKPPDGKYSETDSFKYGILLGFLNPVQIPFWIITGTYLITHEWILAGQLALVIFSFGSAAGAFLCLFLYAHFARYIQSKFALSNRLINTAIAILFFAFAAYHVVKRVYLAMEPPANVKQVYSNSFLIGQWGIYGTISTKETKGDSITYEETSSTLCNECPAITFVKDQTGFIKNPGKEIFPFTCKITSDKLVFKNTKQESLIEDGTYKIIYTSKLKYKEIELAGTAKNFSYIIRQ